MYPLMTMIIHSKFQGSLNFSQYQLSIYSACGDHANFNGNPLADEILHFGSNWLTD